MGHSKSAKGKTHKRIVTIASKRFREEGLAGIGIAELMKEAGLTVGGFYKHFKSRDDLVAESVGSALGFWKRQVDAAASGGPPVTYESLVDDYLSEHIAIIQALAAQSALWQEISHAATNELAPSSQHRFETTSRCWQT